VRAFEKQSCPANGAVSDRTSDEVEYGGRRASVDADAAMSPIRVKAEVPTGYW
jgi:hypothetical protein